MLITKRPRSDISTMIRINASGELCDFWRWWTLSHIDLIFRGTLACGLPSVVVWIVLVLQEHLTVVPLVVLDKDRCRLNIKLRFYHVHSVSARSYPLIDSFLSLGCDITVWNITTSIVQGYILSCSCWCIPEWLHHVYSVTKFIMGDPALIGHLNRMLITKIMKFFIPNLFIWFSLLRSSILICQPHNLKSCLDGAPVICVVLGTTSPSCNCVVRVDLGNGRKRWQCVVVEIGWTLAMRLICIISSVTRTFQREVAKEVIITILHHRGS